MPPYNNRNRSRSVSRHLENTEEHLQRPRASSVADNRSLQRENHGAPFTNQFLPDIDANQVQGRPRAGAGRRSRSNAVTGDNAHLQVLLAEILRPEQLPGGEGPGDLGPREPGHLDREAPSMERINRIMRNQRGGGYLSGRQTSTPSTSTGGTSPQTSTLASTPDDVNQRRFPEDFGREEIRFRPEAGRDDPFRDFGTAMQDVRSGYPLNRPGDRDSAWKHSGKELLKRAQEKIDESLEENLPGYKDAKGVYQEHQGLDKAKKRQSTVNQWSTALGKYMGRKIKEEAEDMGKGVVGEDNYDTAKNAYGELKPSGEDQREESSNKHDQDAGKRLNKEATRSQSSEKQQRSTLSNNPLVKGVKKAAKSEEVRSGITEAIAAHVPVASNIKAAFDAFDAHVERKELSDKQAATEDPEVKEAYEGQIKEATRKKTLSMTKAVDPSSALIGASLTEIASQVNQGYNFLRNEAGEHRAQITDVHEKSSDPNLNQEARRDAADERNQMSHQHLTESAEAGRHFFNLVETAEVYEGNNPQAELRHHAQVLQDHSGEDHFEEDPVDTRHAISPSQLVAQQHSERGIRNLRQRMARRTQSSRSTLAPDK